MICYKDRTFCPFWAECESGPKCPSALTGEVAEGAAKWWGSDEAPISMYMSKPKCFEAREEHGREK
jgi:hypothetical protein